MGKSPASATVGTFTAKQSTSDKYSQKEPHPKTSSGANLKKHFRLGALNEINYFCTGKPIKRQ